MKKLIIAIISMTMGCTTSFYKSVDGVCVSVGITVPDTEPMQFETMSYLSGQKVVVKEPSKIHHRMSVSSTNEYAWGMIKVNEHRTLDIYVAPTNNLTTAQIVSKSE